MTEPCRSDCPAGDCAGCAFPPTIARCKPSTPCAQAERCARRDPGLCDRKAKTIDGTLLRHACGAFCPLFVDRRGAMLEAA